MIEPGQQWKDKTFNAVITITKVDAATDFHRRVYYNAVVDGVHHLDDCSETYYAILKNYRKVSV